MSFAVFGQILLKKGVTMSLLSNNFTSFLKTFFTPYILLGFLFYGISSIVWLFVLKSFSLSIAAPLLSLSYVFIFLYASICLKEAYTIYNVLGLFLIVIGAALINIR